MNRNDAAKHRRFRALVAKLLEYENIPTTARAGDDPGPDLDTSVAWIATSAQTLARVGHNLATARREAREADDRRPVVLIAKHERSSGLIDALAVVSVHDLAQLLGRAVDTEEVAA